MRCINPFRMKNPQFPEESDLEFIDCACGKCFPCLVNRRNAWLFRLTNEAISHDLTTFCTLTYDDDNLPKYGYVSRCDLQKFFKRLRHYTKFSYYAIGEYGTTTFRPHYHFIGFFDGVTFDDVSTWVSLCWKYGFTSTYRANVKTINYILHYHVRPKNPIPNDPYCRTFQTFSKRLGLQFLFDDNGNIKQSVIDMVCNSDRRHVGDIYGRHFILPRYYTKKIEEMGYTLYKRSDNPDYSQYEMKRIIDLITDYEIKYDSQGYPLNFPDDKFVSLMQDIMDESKKKLKRYDYQSKNFI